VNIFLQENARYLTHELDKIDGIKVIKPQGTMYILIGIDSDKFNFSYDAW
jgi:aspartate/methionine/tyrosine aminotransferase